MVRMQTGDWFGVRCWFLFESGALDMDRGQLYEERVTIWCAANVDDARKQAAAEGDAYAGEVGATRIDYIETYRMADPPREGAEVWSVMRDSWLPPDEYLARFVTEGVPAGRDA
jgi:hypothetical protein